MIEKKEESEAQRIRKANNKNRELRKLEGGLEEMISN